MNKNSSFRNYIEINISITKTMKITIKRKEIKVTKFISLKHVK